MATTSDLINQIKLRGSFPTSDDLFSNADYLSILNDEMMNHITPMLTKLNEEYFLAYQDTQLTVGQSEYRIPKRAAGSMLRDVQLISASGSVISLGRLFEEDKYSTNNGQSGYYIKSNQVVISPTPASGDMTLRLAYFRRPSKFVLPTSCAKIISINVATKQVTVSSLPGNMTTGTQIDFFQADSPYDLLDMNSIITNAAGTTVTFSALPKDLAIGDYLGMQGETCAPMIPEELVPVLVQAALCTCLSSKKDKSVELELQKLEQQKQSVVTMLAPRVKSNDVKIKTSNSLLNNFRSR